MGLYDDCHYHDLLAPHHGDQYIYVLYICMLKLKDTAAVIGFTRHEQLNHFIRSVVDFCNYENFVVKKFHLTQNDKFFT